MAGIFYTLVFLAQSITVSPYPVMIVLDGSQAMANPVSGTTVHGFVQDALLTVIAEAQSREGEIAIGLQPAGGAVDGDRECNVFEPLIDIGAPDWGQWTSTLNSVEPRGKRPLYSAVASTVSRLADRDAARVVVITSGADQCDGSLLEVAAELSKTGGSVELRLVGLNLEAGDLETFAPVAHRNATNPQELSEAIRWAVLGFDDADGAEAPEPTPTPIPVGLTAPAEIGIGESFELEWFGPENAEDFLSLAHQGSPDGDYLEWARADEGNPTRFRAPNSPGSYELRYVDGETGEIRARAPLEVAAAPVELVVPRTVVAGRRFEVVWTGSARDGEFIAVSKAGSAIGRFTDWATLAHGSPTTLAAPTKPGTYEVRHYSRGGVEILDSVAFRVRK